jgi:G3E family GTPase
MNPTNKIPIVALCGFLGSGKTTLLRRWSRDKELENAAMIVHDLSDFGLDAELLSDEENAPVKGGLSGRVAALHGIHARGQLHSSVADALEQISTLQPAPPMVLCESTGAARPWPLIKALTQNDQYFLKHFIVTVDALNLHRDFDDGRTFTGESAIPQDGALRCAVEILAEQIAFASVIILTKVDTLPKKVVDQQVNTLQKLQPRAAIGLSAHGGILLSQLQGAPQPKLARLAGLADQLGLAEQSATAEQIECKILRDPRPFHPERLHQVCLKQLNTGIFRTKGFLWLASRPGDVLLWQQSGSQIALELTGSWRAEVVKDKQGKLLPEEVEHLKLQLKSEHPAFGDRHNELTIIGLKDAREGFYEALQQALCTDAEVAAWQRGQAFADPWPKAVNKID